MNKNFLDKLIQLTGIRRPLIGCLTKTYLQNICDQAWRFPLLFWALQFLIGCGCALHPHWIYLFPFLAFTLLSNKKGQCCLFFTAGILFAFHRNTLPTCNEIEGCGVFSLESIQPSHSPFQSSILLKGTLKSFKTQRDVYYNIPCIIYQNSPPTLGTKWLIHGTLYNKERFVFKADREIPWKNLKNRFSLAQYRFLNKEAIRLYFQTRIPNKRVGYFFSSMATGDIDNWLLAMEFRKVGLGHILAISGFHFALIATLLGSFLGLFMPQRCAYIALLSLLTIYFVFLGISPSILRAFIMIALYLVGLILRRRIDALNLLGAALLVELIINPLNIEHIGFQLSFLATLGILLFYTSFNRLLFSLIPERKIKKIEKISLINQHGYLIATTIRKAFALNLSVLCTTLPTMFAIFHCFPLLSIPYNLLLTPLLGIALLILPFGAFISPVGALNVIYTGWLLQLIANPPEILNFKVFSNFFSFTSTIFITTIIGAIGLTKRDKQAKLS